MLKLLLQQEEIGFSKPTTGSTGGMPFITQIPEILGALMVFALAMCVAGMILSAGLWAVGAFSSNYTQSVNGKKGFLICVGSALVIGASYLLIQYFFGLGNKATAMSTLLTLV